MLLSLTGKIFEDDTRDLEFEIIITLMLYESSESWY